MLKTTLSMFNKLALALSLAAVTAALPAKAASLVTYMENPDLTNTTLANSSVFDFNSLNTGNNYNVVWEGVGTFDQLHIKTADTYGGATDDTHPFGTKYSVQGVGTTVSVTTLDLFTDSSYFGFWWSAGDAANKLEFYNDGELVQEFTTASLLGILGDEYYGNPKNRDLNSSEPYAFINFFGDSSTSWDQIVFTNVATSGFESDNYSSRVASWNPPTDGPLPGKPVAIIDPHGETPVTEEDLVGSYWENSAPGAPAPPLPLILAFGLAAIVKFRKKPQAA